MKTTLTLLLFFCLLGRFFAAAQESSTASRNRKDPTMMFNYNGKLISHSDLEGVYAGNYENCPIIAKLLEKRNVPFCCCGGLAYGIGVPKEEYLNAMRAIFADKNGRRLFRQYLSELDELEKHVGTLSNKNGAPDPSKH